MKKFYLFITLIFLFSYNNSKALSPGEIAALNDLKNAFEPIWFPANINNCNSFSSFIVVCNANGNVVELALWGGTNKIKNPIPASIGNLIHLESLIIENIYSTGPIPSTIGNLSNLKVLKIKPIGLTGTLPNSFYNLVNLEYLEIHDNKLSGSISPLIGNLTKLKELILSGTNFTGTIPNTIANLNQIKKLVIAGNQLSGSIPSSIGNLTNLETLGLGHNQLSGSIPSSIGNLTNLEILGLGHNQLSGSIPSSIGNLTNLETLVLGYNQLSGSIPSSIGDIIGLNRVMFNNNFLTDSLPNSFSDNSGQLYLENNNLTYIPIMNNIQFRNYSNNYISFANVLNNCNSNQYCSEFIPQKKMAQSETKIVTLGNSLTLNSIPFSTPTDQIQWFLNGNPIVGATSTSYNIPNISNADLGLYTYEITNPLAQGLTLEIEPILVIDTSLANVPKDYQELLDLKIEMDLTYWSGVPSCNWAGITCDANNNVVGLDLSNKNFTGEVPQMIQNFTHLKSLKLNNNSFTSMPDFNTSLSLDTLWIHNNKFTFDDILPNVGAVNNFLYTPQDSLYTYVFASYNRNLTRYAFLETTLINPNNQYLWTGSRIIGTNTNPYYFADSVLLYGIFFLECEVSNPSLPGLTITHYFSISIPVPLPIELAYFNAALEEKNNSDIVNLNWATLSETNNNYFEIQRSSNNKTWKTIGIVEGQGNSSNLENYNFIDETPTQGNNYYRLKQTDFDGQFSVSEIRLVKIRDEDNEISIHPNPAQNTVQIQFSQDLFQPVDLSIFSLDGKLLLNQQIQENNFNFDVSSLSAGIYLIKAKNNNQIITKRLVIQK